MSSGIKLKVETIEQYKVLKHINENFYPDRIKVEIVDRLSLKVSDDEGGSIIFSWDGTRVVAVEG